MTSSDEQRLLDPERVAQRGFSTSFRGFDQGEVRRFLDELATALRRSEDDEQIHVIRPELDRIIAERDELQSAVTELESELTELIDRVRRAEERADEAAIAAAAAPTVPAEVDEATLTLFLGQETVRVLETARVAARDITARAEAEATARLAALEEREAAVAAELSEKQREVEASLAELTTSTEADTARLRAEVEEATMTLRSVAENEALALREQAAADAAVMRADVEKLTADLRSSAEADAARMRREAETDAARVRNESAADALAAQDSAREQARLMLTEAQAVREKVLADLVKRRRAGRQQLDQVKAARDRLARALAVVRKDLDEAMSEVVAAVPEARAAMEAVGRRVPESVDAKKAAELAVELDSVRGSGGSLVEDAEALPDIDALFDRLRAGDADKADAEATTSETEVRSEGSPESAEVVGELVDVPAEPELVSETDRVPRRSKPAARETARRRRVPVEPAVENEPPVADLADELVIGDDVEVEVEVEETADIDGVTLVDGEPTGRHTDVADQPIGDDNGEEEGQVTLPDAFVERDVAMTRLGPDLRRQLKRALADDQSVVLDGLRRVRRTATIGDLPSITEVTATYVAAFEGPLRSAAESGAAMGGGRRSDKIIDQLIERVARSLAEPLRERVERSIERSGGDKTEVLDPIRAQYREARATELPSIADDALAEAFALGLYHSLPDGTVLAWVPDPRSEPGPDCFDNTLAGPIEKPDAFPTGHKAPLGGPGCRCLVLRSDASR